MQGDNSPEITQRSYIPHYRYWRWAPPSTWRVTDTCSEIPDKPIQQHGKSILVQVQTQTEDRDVSGRIGQRVYVLPSSPNLKFSANIKKKKRERGGWEHSYIATSQSIVLQSRALELWKRAREDNSTFRNTTHSDYIPCPTSQVTDAGATRSLSVCTWLCGRTKHPSHSHV